jgi:acid phosphatase
MRQSVGSRRRVVAALAAAVVVAASVWTAVAVAKGNHGSAAPVTGLSGIKHIVVIYEENHSFDNLYGGWEKVNGLSKADAAHTVQVDQAGNPYTCLRQNDANLTSTTPLPATCADTTHSFASAFGNAPFTIDKYIPPTAKTCPPPLQAFTFTNGLRDPGIDPATGAQIGGVGAGGCTRDIVHKFYQEQYQLNGGKQNRYVVGSDAIGLTMGVYDTKQLPVYKWLHSAKHPSYAIADNFFQAAFGGSFLNHQWLIAARSPEDPNAPANLHSLVDPAGFPRNNYPLYTPVPGVTYRDSDFTVACPSPVPGLACGNWAVNTMQPSFEPFGTFGEKLVAQSHATIGDRLTAKGVDWAWYAGGWSNAAGDVNGPGWTNGTGPTCSSPTHDQSPTFKYPKCPDNVFQYHHQPFVYFSNYAPGTPGRAHLQDEQAFLGLLDDSRKPKPCALKPVSFVKPLGEENEHPGYSSEPVGSDHLTHVLQFIEGGNCKKDTLVIVNYDEFGGQWDHVPPPGQAGGPAGPHDEFGPGTRIPALIIAPGLKGDFVVDHTSHDTTSILATIEHRFQLEPLSTRDAQVADLSSVWKATG